MRFRHRLALACFLWTVLLALVLVFTLMSTEGGYDLSPMVIVVLMTWALGLLAIVMTMAVRRTYHGRSSRKSGSSAGRSMAR